MQMIPLKVEENGGTIPLGLEPVRVVDAVSPTAVVERVSDGVVLTVHDLNGTTTAEIHDGEQGEPGKPGQDGAPGAPGAPGQPGADGVSPTVSVEDIAGGHRITITDATGSHSFDVLNGAPGEVPIDDNAGIGDTTKVWSADKSATEASQLLTAITDKQDAPASGSAAGKVLGLTEVSSELVPTWVDQPSVPVTDVQVNGSSVLSNGVANVPMASNAVPGAVQVSDAYGTQIKNNLLSLAPATDSYIKLGADFFRPIAPARQDQAVFWGLAKVAGVNLASETATLGTYPDAAKIAIQKMLGIYQAPWELIREDSFTNAEEADHFITVDGNGEPFELTDVILMFETPVQETAAGKGQYGQVLFYWTGQAYISTENGAWTQTAGATAHGLFSRVTQDGNLLTIEGNVSTTPTNSGNIRWRYGAGFYSAVNGIRLLDSPYTFSKIGIPKVTGTGHYIILGKRKWTV